MAPINETAARQPRVKPGAPAQQNAAGVDILAGETLIGSADKTDPHLPVVRVAQSNPLLTANMPAGSRRRENAASSSQAHHQPEAGAQTAPNRHGAKTATPQQQSDVARDYQKLATTEEQQAFREFGMRYRQLEKKLVAIEAAAIERKPGFLSSITGVFSAISEWHVKGQMNKVRREERNLLNRVYERADEANMQMLHLNKETPAILQRASVPAEKQGNLPRYLALVNNLDAELTRRATAEKPLAIAHRDQVLILSRRNEAGQTESMMFSYREDGKVSYYKKTGTDTEWKREATIWNDAAFSIGVAFMKGKPFPRIVKPSEDQRRIIAPVKFKEDWTPPEEPRMRR